MEKPFPIQEEISKHLLSVSEYSSKPFLFCVCIIRYFIRYKDCTHTCRYRVYSYVSHRIHIFLIFSNENETGNKDIRIIKFNVISFKRPLLSCAHNNNKNLYKRNSSVVFCSFKNLLDT